MSNNHGVGHRFKSIIPIEKKKKKKTGAHFVLGGNMQLLYADFRNLGSYRSRYILVM